MNEDKDIQIGFKISDETGTLYETNVVYPNDYGKILDGGFNVNFYIDEFCKFLEYAGFNRKTIGNRVRPNVEDDCGWGFDDCDEDGKWDWED